MIPELGHYALVLALVMALAQASLPMVGAARGIRPWMQLAKPAALAQFAFVAFAFLALMLAFATSDFSVAIVTQHSHSEQPLIYKLTRHLGQSRGLAAAVGAHPHHLRRAGRAVRREPAAAAEGAHAQHPGHDLGRVPAVHAADLEPVRAAQSGAGRGRRAQSAAAGSWLSHASPNALSRLCRLLDRVLVRGRCPDRRQGRRGLGALGAAVVPVVLVLPHRRRRARVLVGLQRAGLGRLVVLGPGGECLLHAVADRHRAAAFGAGGREARRAQELDHPALDPHLRLFAARHLPGALRHHHLGAFLRQRPHAWRLHPGAAGDRDRRAVGAVRVARADHARRRAVRAVEPRGRAGDEQPACSRS